MIKPNILNLIKYVDTTYKSMRIVAKQLDQSNLIFTLAVAIKWFSLLIWLPPIIFDIFSKSFVTKYFSNITKTLKLKYDVAILKD